MESISLEQVYADYHDKVVWYVFKKVNDRDLAEDIASDVFLKITEHLESFDSEKSSLSTWVYTITSRTLTDYYRRRRTFVEIPDESGETGAMPAVLVDDDGLDKDLLLEEQLEELAKALTAMQERERDLIILHYYSGLALKDIAVKMGMSYANAKVVHKKALGHLKQLMAI